jgi:very-short-patch-repair endonuclease
VENLFGFLMKVFIGVVIFVLIAAVVSGRKGGPKTSANDIEIRKRRPLTEREQSMYFRLCSTFPELVVLSQVSFSALLISPQQSTRNGYNRKVADFVLCTKAFDVLAVIELDDKSHNGKEAADEVRDSWLKSAGLRIIRYPNIPDESRLKTDFPPMDAFLMQPPER